MTDSLSAREKAVWDATGGLREKYVGLVTVAVEHGFDAGYEAARRDAAEETDAFWNAIHKIEDGDGDADRPGRFEDTP
jgi:hypothetical protein